MIAVIAIDDDDRVVGVDGSDRLQQNEADSDRGSLTTPSAASSIGAGIFVDVTNHSEQQQLDANAAGTVEAEVSPRSLPFASAAQSPLSSPQQQEQQEQPFVTTEIKADNVSANKDGDNNENQQTNSEEEEDDDDLRIVKLTKSTRFKGYLTIALASIINQHAAALSADPAYVNAVPASQSQKDYALTVSIISAIISGACVVLHLDRYTSCSTLWEKAFAPQSKIESGIIAFLCIWWSVAVIVQTGVRGIAGDGKEQYNLYCSTWLNCLVSWWTAERKLVDGYGFTTFRTFVTSWPYRAPGWIAIWLTTFFTLFWYVDLFVNTSKHPERVAEPLVPFYANIPASQYQWLILVASFTLLPSGVFIFAELIRQNQATSQTKNGEKNQVQQGVDGESTGANEGASSNDTTPNQANATTNCQEETNNTTTNKKGNGTAGMVSTRSGITGQTQKPHLELIFEGFCLAILVASWIPCCVIATTPGGFASLIGNAYFFTWGTTIFVVETFLWFIHDFRGNVHKSIEQSEMEYRRHQQQVLQKSKEYIRTTAANQTQNDRNNINSEMDDADNDEEEIQFFKSAQMFEEDNDGNGDDYDSNNDTNNHQPSDEDDNYWKMYMSPTSNGDDIPHSTFRRQGGGNNYTNHNLKMHDNEHDGICDDDDDCIRREIQLKQSNSDEYFKGLQDILE